jgi:hypothetical protein
MAAQRSIHGKRMHMIAGANLFFPRQYCWRAEKIDCLLKTPAMDLYYRQEFLRKRQTNNLAGLELASQQCVIRGLNDGVE